MSAKGALEKTVRSGHCGLGATPEMHDRCSGRVVQYRCPCECHEEREVELPVPKEAVIGAEAKQVEVEVMIAADTYQAGFDDACAQVVDLIVGRADQWDDPIRDSAFAELLDDVMRLGEDA